MKNLNKRSIVLTLISALTMFTLSLFADIEPNDDFDNAESIQLNYDITGSLNTSGDREDVFKITTTVDGRLSLILEQISEMDYKIFIYDNDDLDGNGDQLIRWEHRSGDQIAVNLSPDTYYIKISNIGIADGGGYKFNTKFEEFANYDIEDNDVKETANVLELNKTNHGNLMNRKNGNWDSHDFWKITIPKEGRLTINDNTESTLQYKILLYDADGSTVIWSENRPKDNSGKRMAYNLSANSYYIEIRKDAGGYSTYGSYTILPEFILTKYQDTSEPNDDKENAKNVELEVEVVGTLGSRTNGTWDNKDYWTFTLEKDAKVIINDIPVSTLGYKIALEKSSGWRFTSINRTSNNIKTKIEQDLTAGDYVVIFDNKNTSNGTYGSYSMTIEVDQQMSINENISHNRLKVYPNPAKENIYIETGFKGLSILEIIDTNGRIVISDIIPKEVSEIDISSIEKGIYFVKIYNEKVNEIQKIIVE